MAAILAFMLSHSFYVNAEESDPSNGNDSVDFRLKDLHGKWSVHHGKQGNGQEFEQTCLQSKMSSEPYGKPYFCNTTTKDSNGILIYLPSNIYLEPDNPFTTIKVRFLMIDGTETIRTYFVSRTMDHGNENVIQLMAPQHVHDFVYYAPITKRFDFIYNETKEKTNTFTINNPGFDKDGNLIQEKDADE